MYAIVDVKDKQFKVHAGDRLYVPRHADAEPDATLTLDRVLLASDGDGTVHVGTPTVEGASVTARVLGEVKGDKVIVFKKKRRKRYKVKRGHRQRYTQIQIEALTVDGTTYDAPVREEAAPPAAEEEAAAPMPEPEAEAAPLMAEPAPADAAEPEAADTTDETATDEPEALDLGATDAADETATDDEADDEVPDAEPLAFDLGATDAPNADASDDEAATDDEADDDEAKEA
jgi:large subunit ribosomal protein L21